MHDGTTRALLIARWSDTEAHCIGLLEGGGDEDGTNGT